MSSSLLSIPVELHLEIERAVGGIDTIRRYDIAG